MRNAAYLFLTLAVTCLAAMLLCFFLAMFSDLLSPHLAARRWSSWALPAGMGTLFFFGVGAALAREAAVREEFDRAVRLLRKDLNDALGGENRTPAETLAAVTPAILRFRRAAEILGSAAPRAWVDLSDLILLEEDEPERVLHRLSQLQRQLGGTGRG